MIATLLNIDELKESYLILVIQPDNLDRMRQADPFTIETKAMKGILEPAKYPERFAVLVAYEENEPELWKACQTGNVGDMLRYLERGRKFLKIDGSAQAFSLTKGREAEKKGDCPKCGHPIAVHTTTSCTAPGPGPCQCDGHYLAA